MNKLREAVRLILNSTLSNRLIAENVDLSHTSISKYRNILFTNNLTWPAICDLSDSEFESIFRKKRNYAIAKIEPNYLQIHKEMQYPNVTLNLLWEDYCLANPGNAYSFSSFAYKYRKFIKKLDLSMRQRHRAGHSIFVDFAGTKVQYFDPKTGEEKWAQVFVAVMGCSNFTFACAVNSQSLPDWIEAHNRMFQYLGGVPEIIVPDNLKSAVIKAGSDLTINRTYLELCKYYGIVVVPTRVRKPKDKAKAENGVLIVSRFILARLRHRKFFSIEEINREITDLLWQLNERPFKKLPGCRRSRFEEFDKPLLKSHPGKPFEYAEWISKQKVGQDYHVQIHDHYYSVPYELVGEYVEARVTKNIVEILFSGKRIASHPRSFTAGDHTTIPAHQPKEHRQYSRLSPEYLRSWAKNIGPHSLAAIEHQFNCRPHAVLGLKPCGTLQKLAKEYGPDKFEAACKRAEKIGSLTVKSIRSILKRKLIDIPDEHAPVQITMPFHDNVRGAHYYASNGGESC